MPISEPPLPLLLLVSSSFNKLTDVAQRHAPQSNSATPRSPHWFVQASKHSLLAQLALLQSVVVTANTVSAPIKNKVVATPMTVVFLFTPYFWRIYWAGQLVVPMLNQFVVFRTKHMSKKIGMVRRFDHPSVRIRSSHNKNNGDCVRKLARSGNTPSDCHGRA